MSGLMGIKEISDYLRLSETTLQRRVREYDFPMKKFGGIWMSDTDEIDKWRRDFIAGTVPTGDKGDIFPKKPPRKRRKTTKKQ